MKTGWGERETRRPLPTREGANRGLCSANESAGPLRPLGAFRALDLHPKVGSAAIDGLNLVGRRGDPVVVAERIGCHVLFRLDQNGMLVIVANRRPLLREGTNSAQDT